MRYPHTKLPPSKRLALLCHTLVAILTILVQLHSHLWLLLHFTGGAQLLLQLPLFLCLSHPPQPLAVGEAYLVASVALQLTGILRLQPLRFRMLQRRRLLLPVLVCHLSLGNKRPICIPW